MADDPLSAVADDVFRQSEVLFKALIENAHDVIIMLDREGRVLYASPGVRQYGNDPDEIRGKNVWANIHPEDLPSIRAEFAKLIEEPGALARIDVRVGNRDGQGPWRYKEAVLHNLLNLLSVGAVVVNVHDITARKEAEEDLKKLNLSLWEENQRRRQAEEKFRNVIRDQTEFIVRWRPDGTRTFVNESYCRFFGKSEAELLGTSFFPLVLDEEARTRVEQLGSRLTPERDVSEYEHRVPRPDGSIGWTHWCDRGIFDEFGKLVEIQSVGRDITPVKDAAEKLQRLSDELAHVSRLSLLGEMMAEINHEICQPLQAVTTFATAAIKGLEVDDEGSRATAVEQIRKIRDQVQRAAEIVKRRLAYAKAAESQHAEFDIQRAVGEALEMIAHTARRRGIRLKTQLDPALPPVVGDRLQIEQVLVNLLRNACEAMEDTPPGEREVLVRASCDNGAVRVSVRDRGSGLSGEIVGSLFQSFASTKPGGVGIGLVISRRIIDDHGGKLLAQPNPDRGTTFAFTLPPATGEAGHA